MSWPSNLYVHTVSHNPTTTQLRPLTPNHPPPSPWTAAACCLRSGWRRPSGGGWRATRCSRRGGWRRRSGSTRWCASPPSTLGSLGAGSVGLVGFTILLSWDRRCTRTTATTAQLPTSYLQLTPAASNTHRTSFPPHPPPNPQALSYTDEDFMMQLEGPHLDKVRHTHH
jgi:hypothetical protein